MTIEPFPQKAVSDYTSLMSLLRCDDCNNVWVGLYTTGTTVAELHCPYCQSTNLTNRQGEREVIFYDYRDESDETGAVA